MNTNLKHKDKKNKPIKLYNHAFFHIVKKLK